MEKVRPSETEQPKDTLSADRDLREAGGMW